MPLAGQLVHQRYVHPGPLVLRTAPFKSLTPATDRDRTVSRRSEPLSLIHIFGLRTDFRTRLFPGSLRLFELADSITEIKTICDCGRKATVNARIDADGYVITEGSQVFLGGNDSYIAMCHKCYQDYIREHRKVELLHGTERDSE